MLTKEELGSIEKCLDDAGVSPGLYRDGYRACLRNMLEGFKSKAFEEMMQRAFVEAALKVWSEAMAKDFFDRFERAFRQSP